MTFVSDEESRHNGSEYLIRNRRDLFEEIKYGFVAECTALGAVISQKGVITMNVAFKGRAAHGSAPELGDNAIYKASKFIQEVIKLKEMLNNKKEPLLGSGTINLGTIKGGTKVNVVPDYCEIEIDRRTIPGESEEEVIDQIKRILKKLSFEDEIKIGISRMPMKLNANMEIVKVLREITPIRLIGETGYMESALYFNELQLPCVSLGPGLIEQAHTSDEYIPIKNLHHATKIYTELIRKICL